MSRRFNLIVASALIALLPGPTMAAPDSTLLASQRGVVTLTTLARGLDHPWGMVFLPDGRLLFTERVGRLRWLDLDGTVSAPTKGVPEVVAEGQGGLLDVAVSPQFEHDRLVYFSYAEPDRGKLAGTAVARAQLVGNSLQQVEVIFRQQPRFDTRHHFGSRLAFDREGHLFVTLGERGQKMNAQDLGTLQGKVVRLNGDGTIPADNPFVGRDDVHAEIWSYGHRNPQGAAINPWTGMLWTHEHGPMGGDEINIEQSGRNYGWPVITHGIDYSGRPIKESVGREHAGMEAPHHVWPVSPALSGMAFYDHPRFPAWRNSLFIGALAKTALIRLDLDLDGDRVVAEERLLESLHWRIRDVEVGPDGALYVLTDEHDGRILKLELLTPNAN